MKRRALFPVAIASLVGAVTAAHASEPLRLSIVRDGDAKDCPDAAALESSVRARLRRDPFSSGASTQAEVLFSGGPRARRARVRMIDAVGSASERALESDDASCASLADATSLALALYVDPNALASPPPAGAAPPPAPPPPRPAPASREHDAPPSPTSAASLSVSSILAIGALPRPGVGVAFSGGVTLGPFFAAEVFGWLLPEVRTDDRRFGFGMAAAGGRGCLDVTRSRRGYAGPCIGVMGGEIHAVVYESLPTEPGGRAFVAATADLRGQVRLIGPLVASARTGVAAPFVRHRFFVINEAATVFQQAPVVFDAELGLGVSIP